MTSPVKEVTMMRALTTPRLFAILAIGLATALSTQACVRRDGSPAAEPTAGVPTASPSVTAGPSPTPSPTPAGVGTWRMLPGAPAGFHPAASVWTGTELLLYSPGSPPESDGTYRGRGFALNPTTGTWRATQASPYPPANVEGGYSAVWTGTEMMIFGPMDAAYNPVTRRWRKLASGAAGPSLTVWTGRHVLMWGGGCCGENRNTGSRYDPTTNRWRSIPAAPLAGRRADGVWTGRELIVVGGSADGPVFADAAAYNPTTNTWRRLARLPAPRMDATLSWTGQEVLVVGGRRAWDRLYADGLAYRPTTNTWRRLPAMEVSRFGHVAVWTGYQLLVWGGQTVPFDPRTDVYTAPRHGLAYDPVTDRWTALPRAPLRARTGAFAFWTGTEVLIWGGHEVRYPHRPLTDGATLRPA
jgi:hypothetical protein